MIPADSTPAILGGDVLDMLSCLPDDSIHCIVTSPPYWGLRDYGLRSVRWGGQVGCEHEWELTQPRHHRGADGANGGAGRVAVADLYDASQGGSICRKCGAWLGQLGLEPTPERFVEHLAGVFDEVRRVLRPDGTLWLNLGDTYATHPSGLTGEKRWKASTLSGRDHSGAEQAGRIDKRAPGLKPKDLVGIPWRVAFELQRRGWWLRSDCVWAKPNPMPEAVRDRPTRAHDSVFLLTKSRRYFYDAFAVRRAPAGEHASKTPPSSTEPDRQSHLPLEASRWGLPAIPDASKHEPRRPKSPDGVVDPYPALPGRPLRDVPGKAPRALHPGGDIRTRGMRGVRDALDKRGPGGWRRHWPRTETRGTNGVGSRSRRRRSRLARWELPTG